MSANHTPTPWTQYQLGATIYGADGFYVGITQSKCPEADAALIVTAVNSYASSQAEIERLRTIARQARDELQEWINYANIPGSEHSQSAKLIERIDAALSGSKE